MKNLVFVAIAVVLFSACLKSNDVPEPDRILVPMNFSRVITPDSTQVGDTMVAQVTVTGSNLCYRFEGYDGARNGVSEEFDIFAVGSIPNPNKKDTTCPDIQYSKDTVLRITPKTPGKLTLKFYNGSTIFKVDTVVVYN
ncbi:hypothetical protein [Flavihumibacter solisilvae]|uniref:Lipoprotein n=1 Tax=Flavihumibacter solisilvae TaxID=1349421 RepID=A0A0C1KZN4_9BACT|nr:hypothetical protein [Flavihumibacter solisilvae]KIC92751.1 hypothetical protein OI18_21085 [Flavihumibacter solisilvae]